MSLETIRSILASLSTTRAWMVSLVKIKNSAKAGTTYATRGITLSPEGTLSRFIENLSKAYVDGNKAIFNKYTSVADYDGNTEATRIYKLDHHNPLIEDEFVSLIQALANPESTGNPLEFAANAYAIKASLVINEEEKNVVLFSLQNPICVLKNRFLYDNSTFFELDKKVLNLRPNIDVLIVDNNVYLFTMSGEKLFNMERSYKAVCTVKTAEICDSGIISNTEVFSKIATSGHNPRRFAAFNPVRFAHMQDDQTRRRMASLFRLVLNADGHVDTSTPEMVEKLIKVLCDKGMVDPFDNMPVEVSGTSRW